MADTTCYCKTCKRTMDADEFYTSKRLDRYPPDGKMKECKKCLTRHVDNWDPSTYKWILEEIDVPYIEDEWTTLLNRYGQNKKKLTGMTILGRYLSKMKLKQFKDYGWDDTERLQEQANAAKAEVMARQGYSGEEIEKAIIEGSMPERPPEEPKAENEEAAAPIDLNEPEYFEDDLTEEDKKYLTIKWGKAYRPYEWVQLEKLYQEMMAAFDIVTPAHEDYLKLICKTSLKAHQLIDLGDIEGFQKISKVYDTLMKSAKFTAAQNKAESGEYVSAIDEFILLCERDGPIERYYVSEPKDKPDETLADMRNYTHRLVTEELNLGNLIEDAMRKMASEEAKEEDEDTTDNLGLSLDEIETEVLTDADFTEHYDRVENELDEDAATIRELLGEEEE